jgi:hypothetical protein
MEKIVMKLLAKAIAAALVSAAVPLYAGSAAAAPLSQPIMLKTSDGRALEQVQYRRWNGYGEGYDAYAAAPGYDAYGRAPGYNSSGMAAPYRNFNPNYGNGGSAAGPGAAPGCSSDRDQNSGYPSWYCR